ncbi:hypothetical protein HZC27_00670 [Candidatus Roizmanbacteria bacterium]|nr:hypothetical protein [Candidatus Roizmanbacteria bacterium]
MTEFLTMPAAVTTISALVPLLGAVYKAYLSQPVRIRNANDMAKAIDLIMTTTKPELLPKGSHDITPMGASYNFTLEVTGYDDEEQLACYKYHIRIPQGLLMSAMIKMVPREM